MPRARLHIAALMRAVHPCTRGRYRVIIVPSDVTLSARAPCAGEDFVWYFYIDPPLGTVPEPTCANPPPVAASLRGWYVRGYDLIFKKHQLCLGSPRYRPRDSIRVYTAQHRLAGAS